MFDPVLIVSAEARYRELLQEAEAERQNKQAGPAGATRPLLGLIDILLALGLVTK